MYLLVNTNGSKWWRLKYRFGIKEKSISLGVYPETTLAAARLKRRDARQMLENSIDPAQQRRAQKLILSDGAANSFEAVAREWHAKGVPGWSTGHAKKTLTRLEQDIFPWIGTRPIGDIKAPEMLMALRRIEARGAIHTAHRIHQNCGQIMRYAIATGRAERDIASDLRGAIQPETRVHHASIVEPKHIGNLLREMEIYDGLFATKCALRLAPLVFLRPGELRHAEWSEINFDDAEWRIPATKMKMGVVHIVPLSTQAASILRQVYEHTKHLRYVFPSVRTGDRPMSENTIMIL